MSDEADAAIERVANTQPDVPIGCAFLDSSGLPKWIEDEPGLTRHFGAIRGCVPRIHIEE